VVNGFGNSTSPGIDCGGLLGECRAWAYAVETQARGSLHLHIIVWTIDGAHLQERIRNMIRRTDTTSISGSPDAELYTAAQSVMIKTFAELLYRSTTREISVDQSSYEEALLCNFTYACTGRFEVRSLSITKQLRYDRHVRCD
jgi:hypothetical protein